jgi:hypothetical protein
LPEVPGAAFSFGGSFDAIFFKFVLLPSGFFGLLISVSYRLAPFLQVAFLHATEFLGFSASNLLFVRVVDGDGASSRG